MLSNRKCKDLQPCSRDLLSFVINAPPDDRRQVYGRTVSMDLLLRAFRLKLFASTEDFTAVVECIHPGKSVEA